MALTGLSGLSRTHFGRVAAHSDHFRATSSARRRAHHVPKTPARSPLNQSNIDRETTWRLGVMGTYLDLLRNHLWVLGGV